MRFVSGLTAGREALFVPGCRPVDRRLFVPGNLFHARHVWEHRISLVRASKISPRRFVFDRLEDTRDVCLMDDPTRRRPVLPILAPPHRPAVRRRVLTRPWFVLVFDSTNGFTCLSTLAQFLHQQYSAHTIFFIGGDPMVRLAGCLKLCLRIIGTMGVQTVGHPCPQHLNIPSNPKPGHTTGGSGRSGVRRRGGAGRGGAGRNAGGTVRPGGKPILLPPRASKTTVLIDPPEARTNAIPCKPMGQQNIRLTTGWSTGP